MYGFNMPGGDGTAAAWVRGAFKTTLIAAGP